MEFEVNGHTYQNKKLNVFQQSYVLKRVLPVFSGIVKALSSTAEIDMEPLADAMSKLSDADSDFVLNTCLATVQRKQGEVWPAIKTGQSFMFDDIDLPVVMQITWNVLQDNFSSFFLGKPILSLQSKPTSNGQA